MTADRPEAAVDAVATESEEFFYEVRVGLVIKTVDKDKACEYVQMVLDELSDDEFRGHTGMTVERLMDAHEV